jgi:hypothetical protein
MKHDGRCGHALNLLLSFLSFIHPFFEKGGQNDVLSLAAVVTMAAAHCHGMDNKRPRVKIKY